MVIKIKKKKKSKKLRGTNTHGWGSRKKHKNAGNRGGIGMAGSGKKADQKKSLVIKLYGNKYFGKQGITSKSTKKDKRKSMNLEQIQKNFESIMKKFGDNKKINLKNYKILGSGEIKQPVEITAKEFSKSAKEKIEKVGGKAIITGTKKEKTKNK